MPPLCVWELACVVARGGQRLTLGYLPQLPLLREVTMSGSVLLLVYRSLSQPKLSPVFALSV